MNTAAAEPVDSAHAAEQPHHRRSREEVEALAKNFVATPVEDVPLPKPRTRLVFAGGGLAVLGVLAVLAVAAWPERDEDAGRPQADKARVTAEAEQWRARYEAERERKRKELKAGSEYMARMAAADAAILREMSERATRLTAVTAATPEPASARKAPANSEPTPKDEPTPRKSTQVASAAPAPEPAKPQPSAAKTASAPAPAEKSEPAPPPAVVAAAECKLHVSQLSASGTLTYAEVSKMKGARTLGSGAVVLPPVTADGRRVIFTVTPDGCMTWRRA